MTPAELQAYVDAADAYKRRDGTVAQATLYLNCFPATPAERAALARIALAAVRSVSTVELHDALRDAGLIASTEEPQP